MSVNLKPDVNLKVKMDEDIYYGDEYPDLSDIDEDMLRAYLEGKEVSPELEEILKGWIILLKKNSVALDRDIYLCS